MDSEDSETKKNKRYHHILLRLILVLVFPVFASFSIGLLAILVGELSASSSVSVPSQCKIVSSSVDIRSSKVCELGVLNYRAKRVFYPFETSKFRCRYDYYWASVFKVEYRDHSLGQTRFALAEAPDEALPLNCRPNFGAAWLTKDKFKVNETYDCWYSLGFSKVSLYRDGFFSCHSKGPSPVEMLRRYFILSMLSDGCVFNMVIRIHDVRSVKMLQSWFTSKRRTMFWRWETMAGIITGFFTSFITIGFATILQQMKNSMMFGRVFSSTRLRCACFLRLRCACFLVVYLCVMGWLAIQYGKSLGVLKIFPSL